MRRCLVPVILLAGGALVAQADEIDDYFARQLEAQHIPGVALAVIEYGHVTKATGYGLANLEHQIPVRPDTVFKIGSLSKQFIATGIMLLVQDGRLSVSDNISEHLDGAPSSWNSITLRHLLTHTSGLVREGPGFDPYVIQPDIEVIKSAYSEPLLFQPGDKYQYSNLGYFVLADVIRRVSGKPWPEFLTERVFAPLGMNATGVTTVEEIVPKRADGYDWAGDEFRNMPDWPAVRPSGAFRSTVLDLAKWEAALLTDRILSESSKREMWTWVTLNDGGMFPYGFGWQLNDWPADARERTGVPMIRHGGSIPGFRAGFLRWPSKGLAVIVLTNREDANVDALGANIAIRAAPELRTEER